MSYRHLQDHCKEISWFDQATKMLGCDSMVMMPAGGDPAGPRPFRPCARRRTHSG